MMSRSIIERRSAIEWRDLPLAELVDRFYAELQAEGGGRLDISSLRKRYQP
jgi:3-hydroxyisobutyrate dehydrogenase-like beta-hydroxyacid dehydrogenase